MIRFITYLSGNKNWIYPQYIIPSVKYETDSIILLRKLLGTESLQNCIALARICLAQPNIAVLLPKESVELDFAGILQQVQTATTQLVTTGNSVGASLPMDTVTPSDVIFTLSYLTDKKARITTGEHTYTVLASSADKKLVTVQWPEEFGIKGNIKLGDNMIWAPGTTVVLPTRSRYPIAYVDKQLCRSDAVYDILWKQNLVEAFYSADTPEERVGICVLALIDLVKL